MAKLRMSSFPVVGTGTAFDGGLMQRTVRSMCPPLSK